MERVFEEVLAIERPDVVHFHHLTGFGLGALAAARRARARVVLTLHDFWLGCPRSQRITRDLDRCPTIDRGKCAPCLRALYGAWIAEGDAGSETLLRYDARVREALAGADRLVTPSRFVADLYAGETGIPRDRFSTIPVGLDPAPFEGLVRERSERFRISCAGTLLPSKGAHVLLDALRSLPAERVRIDVHGEAVPWFEERDYLATLRARVRPGDPVRFTGPYDPPDLPRLLADTDALVVPSLWFEAFSITVREGWLAGLPVVASRLGAMEEAIEDGVDGLLFAPGDAADLARKLRRLLEDPALRARLASSPKRVATSAETARALLASYSEGRL
jgi:glycosyltransferase involved in cell wall biosynthesis